MSLGDLLFPRIDMNLVIARSFESDIESVKDMFSAKYLDVTARIHMNGTDMLKLGVKDGRRVTVKSRAGMVVVRADGDDKVPMGIGVMPHGPWALALVLVPTDASPPQLHGIAVTVERTQAEITPLTALLSS